MVTETVGHAEQTQIKSTENKLIRMKVFDFTYFSRVALGASVGHTNCLSF